MELPGNSYLVTWPDGVQTVLPAEIFRRIWTFNKTM